MFVSFKEDEASKEAWHIKKFLMPKADNQWKNSPRTTAATEAQFKTQAAVQKQSAAFLHCLPQHLLNRHSFAVCLSYKSFVTFSSTHFTLTTIPSRKHW